MGMLGTGTNVDLKKCALGDRYRHWDKWALEGMGVWGKWASGKMGTKANRLLGQISTRAKLGQRGSLGQMGIFGQMGMLGTGINVDLGKWTVWGNTSRHFETDGHWGK